MPAVVLVTAAFEPVARASADARGMPSLPVIVFPGDLEERSDDEVATAFAERWPAICAALTRSGC